jgi:hypothetical protein
MKPKILESFKDYNVQKEFLSKVSQKKQITIIVKNEDGFIQPQQGFNTPKNISKQQSVIVYYFGKNQIRFD